MRTVVIPDTDISISSWNWLCYHRSYVLEVDFYYRYVYWYL